jgi:hypothetical protein
MWPRHSASAASLRRGRQAQPQARRELDTGKRDLEFACIFPLVDPQTGLPHPKDCTLKQYSNACDCASTALAKNTQLCQKDNGAYTSMQINGKAYPSVRELAIAHAMANSPKGVQGIVSSLCPIHTEYKGGTTDPLYGYRPAANAIVTRLKNALSVQCLPQKLNPDKTTGIVDCLILVTLPGPGDQSICTSGTVPGFDVPPPDVLQNFRAAQKATLLQQGGKGSGLPDPDTLPVAK